MHPYIDRKPLLNACLLEQFTLCYNTSTTGQYTMDGGADQPSLTHDWSVETLAKNHDPAAVTTASPCQYSRPTSVSRNQSRQPAETTSRDNQPRQLAKTTSRDNSPRQPAKTTSQDNQPRQPAETTSPDNPPRQPFETTSQDNQPRQPAETTSPENPPHHSPA